MVGVLWTKPRPKEEELNDLTKENHFSSRASGSLASSTKRCEDESASWISRRVFFPDSMNLETSKGPSLGPYGSEACHHRIAVITLGR